jgi:hypothetical protein
MANKGREGRRGRKRVILIKGTKGCLLVKQNERKSEWRLPLNDEDVCGKSME